MLEDARDIVDPAPPAPKPDERKTDVITETTTPAIGQLPDAEEPTADEPKEKS